MTAARDRAVDFIQLLCNDGEACVKHFELAHDFVDALLAYLAEREGRA